MLLDRLSVFINAVGATITERRIDAVGGPKWLVFVSWKNGLRMHGAAGRSRLDAMLRLQFDLWQADLID